MEWNRMNGEREEGEKGKETIKKWEKVTKTELKELD
jgi:hypothetical protein